MFPFSWKCSHLPHSFLGFYSACKQDTVTGLYLAIDVQYKSHQYDPYKSDRFSVRIHRKSVLYASPKSDRHLSREELMPLTQNI